MRTDAQRRMMEKAGLTEADLSPKPKPKQTENEGADAPEVDRLKQEVAELREALEAFLEGVTE